MGPVRQNPIQRTVRSVRTCVHCTVHNCCTQYCTDLILFPSYPPDNHHWYDDVYLGEGGRTRVDGTADSADISQSQAASDDRLLSHVTLSRVKCRKPSASSRILYCGHSTQYSHAVLNNFTSIVFHIQLVHKLSLFFY